MSEVKRIKPALSKGTRDFLPAEVAKRNYIFDTIKTVFRKYGFEQIETPAIERLDTLTGKYGEEGDKLLFKILNSGDPFKDITQNDVSELRSKGAELAKQITEKYVKETLTEEHTEIFEREIQLGLNTIARKITEKGLRYDLTVPLARYVVQHQDDLAFPFKRFHIGPVWRADRPQKGRYQEFFQCDADIIGSSSILNEVELTMIYAEVFDKLGLNVTIRINSRKILESMAFLFLRGNSNVAERPGDAKFVDFITTLDKLDKIGEDGVLKELVSKGYEAERISQLQTFLREINKIDSPLQRLAAFRKEANFNAFTPHGSLQSGLDEVERLFSLLYGYSNVEFDLTLARGLDYYTGIVWEIELVVDYTDPEDRIGSLGGGGRYDNLTEIFGGQNMSGVGISFGIERIYNVMEELKLFPETIAQGVQVLFVPRDISVEEFTFQQVQTLRKEGIAAEIFLGNVKKQKQFTYAEQKNIAYLIEVGDNEKSTGLFRLRNAKTRETINDLPLDLIIQKLTN